MCSSQEKLRFARPLFPGHKDVSMEDPDNLRYIQADPRDLLHSWQADMIIDEAQHAPELFSHIREMQMGTTEPANSYSANCKTSNC